MKRKLLSIGLFVGFLVCGNLANAQVTAVARKHQMLPSTPTLTLSAPNMEQIKAEDAENDRNGMLYRIGVHGYTNITTQNSGAWSVNENGDKVWQLHIDYPGAEALSFLFERFHIYGGTTVNIFDNKGLNLHKTYTTADVLDHGQQNMALCFGDEMTIEIVEPAGAPASDILIDRIVYNYRSTGNPNTQKINESGSCEVNVNCSPVGDAWQEEKRGVARIYVVDASGAGWCTGNLVNNTAQDCKPLFLTALHCGVSTSAANSNQWKFYFGYEAPTCTNPGTAGTLDDNFITGCVRLANSNDNGGDTGSDFLLVQLGSLANEAATITTLKSSAFNAYWNGWDANTTATTGGAGIHHPAGDIKKISTFSGATTSTSWGGSVANTHWQLTWTSNSNGYGVTEGGSSGSPLFNSAGRQIGTLTGGGSFCNAQTSPDAYGKMSFHWTSNGTPTNEQLKTYLDPSNTGALTINGSTNPCSPVTPTAPVANFSASATTVTTGSTVTFTDLSTNTPTSWAWSITPASGWSFAGGTSASSQNPQVTFTTAGVYTISLTASNSAGSDNETKTNYITVTAATAPCTATGTTCDEFIQNVTLNTINNTTACTNYMSYSLSTTLTKGQAYSISIVPQIPGNNPGSAYTDDEIAAWIDYNGDLDFADAGEQIAYVLIGAGTNSTTFNFTVPASATTGTVKMRTRISYSQDGAIDPCGTSTYGEVEDYNIVLIAGTNSISENSLDAVSVYPNPANEVVSIDLTAIENADVSLELMDMTGKVIATKAHVAGTTAQFDLSQVAKGMYQVRIFTTGVNRVERIIKL